MRLSLTSAIRALLAPALLLVLPAPALAQKVEQPPSFNAAQIAGIKRVGPNYTVRNPVRSDGLVRVYVLDTPYGEFTVHGDEMMHMRIREFEALAKLEHVTNSESFTQALAQAGISPLVFTGQMIANPVGTMQHTMQGVGAFFGRFGSGMQNAGKTPDNAMDNLFGVTDQRREIAAKYGVDPYTDLAPLAAKLEQLAKAAATGGLVVRGALLAVPGAAGLVVSNLSTAQRLNNIGIEELARSHTAAQILDLNRAALARMGVAEELRERLLANRHYTPIDMAAFVAALDSMAGVEGREVFAARAAEAETRAIAYFVRRRAEMMAHDHRRHGGYVRFVDLGYPVVVTRDNRALAIAPIDALSWTERTSKGLGFVFAARKQAVPQARGELRITGQATALVKKQMKAHGWTLAERQKF
jgi:hypothetical protein